MPKRALVSFWFAAMTAGWVCLTPGTATASGVDALLVQGSAAVADVDDKDFGEVTGDDEPEVLQGQHIRVQGSGKLLTVGLRGVTQSAKGLRFGLGAGLFATEGLKLGRLSLPAGVSAEAGSIWGFSGEVSLGKAFLTGPIQPYIDMRLAVNVLHVDVALTADPYGLLGSSGYNSASVSTGPRLGVFIPIGNTLCIDLSGSYTLFGIERASVAVGVGLWDGILEPREE